MPTGAGRLGIDADGTWEDVDGLVAVAAAVLTDAAWLDRCAGERKPTARGPASADFRVASLVVDMLVLFVRRDRRTKIAGMTRSQMLS